MCAKVRRCLKNIPRTARQSTSSTATTVANYTRHHIVQFNITIHSMVVQYNDWTLYLSLLAYIIKNDNGSKHQLTFYFLINNHIQLLQVSVLLVEFILIYVFSDDFTIIPLTFGWHYATYTFIHDVVQWLYMLFNKVLDAIYWIFINWFVNSVTLLFIPCYIIQVLCMFHWNRLLFMV